MTGYEWYATNELQLLLCILTCQPLSHLWPMLSPHLRFPVIFTTFSIIMSLFSYTFLPPHSYPDLLLVFSLILHMIFCAITLNTISVPTTVIWIKEDLPFIIIYITINKSIRHCLYRKWGSVLFCFEAFKKRWLTHQLRLSLSHTSQNPEHT